MPPVTPRATSAMTSVGVGRFGGNLFDRLGHHFALRDGGLLVVADFDAGRRSGQELAGAGAGRDDELERILELAAVNHEKVLLIVSASTRIRSSRTRSAMTMPRSRST